MAEDGDILRPASFLVGGCLPHKRKHVNPVGFVEADLPPIVVPQIMRH